MQEYRLETGRLSVKRSKVWQRRVLVVKLPPPDTTKAASAASSERAANCRVFFFVHERVEWLALLDKLFCRCQRELEEFGPLHFRRNARSLFVDNILLSAL